MVTRYIGKIYKILLVPEEMKSKSVLVLAISEPDASGELELLNVIKDDANIGKNKKFLELSQDILGPDCFILDKKCVLNISQLADEVAEIGSKGLEKVLKLIISKEVTKYFQHVHKPQFEQSFIPAKTHINYAGRIFDEKELLNLVDASLEFYLTAGRYDRLFCSKLSDFLHTDSVPPIKALTCNSGSSANLLALSILTSPKLKELAIREGDEVITVAAGFPTSIAPIYQNKLVPVFVDVEYGTYNIKTDKLEKVISDKTKAIFLAHTLGIPFNLDKVLELAERYGLWLIEDNCDALGAKYSLSREYNLIKNKRISGEAYTGTIGHIGTSSFYPAHQITMGEGGAVYTSDDDLYRIGLSFRDWGRDCWCEPGCDNTCGNRFGQQLGKLPKGYDHKYTYSHVGYNFKLTDMQSAIGVAQLDKVNLFARTRYRNWQKLKKGLASLEDKFYMPCHSDNSIPSPFGFALTVRDDAGFKRNDIVDYLESKKIQTRTIFAGNMLRQPALTEFDMNVKIGASSVIKSSEVSNEEFRLLPNTDKIMSDTFWIGVYPGLKAEMIEFMISTIREFVEQS